MDDFDKYPIILCKYTDKEDNEQTMSGTRGDGLCSIWAVLLGWSLLGRKDFIRNKLSNELTFPNNKYTIEIVINSIKKNLGVIIAMIDVSDKQTKDKEITYIPVSEIFNGDFGDQTFTKEECSYTIMQLQQWKKLSTINGSAHLLILAILLGINIRVRDVSARNDIRIFSYGDKNNAVVRITTNGAHYNVHNTKKNNNLDHWTMKHWWKNQWITGSQGKHKQINFNKPITPFAKNYEEVYGPINKAEKKKPQKTLSKEPVEIKEAVLSESPDDLFGWAITPESSKSKSPPKTPKKQPKNKIKAGPLQPKLSKNALKKELAKMQLDPKSYKNATKKIKKTLEQVQDSMEKNKDLHPKIKETLARVQKAIEQNKGMKKQPTNNNMIIRYTRKRSGDTRKRPEGINRPRVKKSLWPPQPPPPPPPPKNNVGKGKKSRKKNARKNKRKKGGSRKVKRKTKKMLCFRGSKKNLKKLGKKSKKLNVRLTKRSKKRLKYFKKN